MSLVLVDASIWIELLNGRRGSGPGADAVYSFVTCGPIIQEVRQGLRDSAESRLFEAHFDALPCIADPLPGRLFVAAADIFRSGRRRGYTIRSHVDCLIAAIAIDNEIALWHRNRDFAAIEQFTELRTVSL